MVLQRNGCFWRGFASSVAQFALENPFSSQFVVSMLICKALMKIDVLASNWDPSVLFELFSVPAVKVLVARRREWPIGNRCGRLLPRGV